MLIDMIKVTIGSIIGGVILYGGIRLIQYDIKRTLRRLEEESNNGTN